MELFVKGTPEELAEWLRQMREPGNSVLPNQPDAEPTQPALPLAVDAFAERPFVEYLKKVLREPLSERTRQFITLLYEAGDAGLDRAEIARRMGLSSQQLQGVNGPLGKRARNTEGHAAQATAHYPHSDSGLVTEVTTTPAGDLHYRLWPAARQAWQELNGLE